MIAVASLDKSVYLVEFKDDEYKPLLGIKIENGFPISLNFSEDSSRILITTNKRQLLLMNSKNYELLSTIEDVSQCYWNEWNGRFCLNTKLQKSDSIPITVGRRSNIVVSGDEFGTVHLWRNPESVKDNVGCSFNGHGSQIQQVHNIDKFSNGSNDSKILSMGNADKTVLQWKINFLYDESFRGFEKMTEKGAKQRKQVYIDDVRIKDDSLINELNYAHASKPVKEKFSDSAVLIRASASKIINRILAK